MPKLLCKLLNASELISGVKFVSHQDGMLSEEVSDEVAENFLSIPGYELASPVKTAAELVAEKQAAAEAEQARQQQSSADAEQERIAKEQAAASDTVAGTGAGDEPGENKVAEGAASPAATEDTAQPALEETEADKAAAAAAEKARKRAEKQAAAAAAKA